MIERISEKIFRKTIQLKTAKRIVGLREVGDLTFWKSGTPPKIQEGAADSVRAGKIEAPGTLGM
jgi:hypothetical protein